MSKELEKEYLEDLDHYDEGMGIHSTSYEKCKERLIRLAKIENAEPSEAVKSVNGIIVDLEDDLQHYTMVEKDKCREFFIRENLKQFTNIKQALLKAQEMEKVIIELCEYCGMDNLYPYDNLEEIEITFKDTFDNYQRQRIESLGRLNKQEKVLKVIFEKGLPLAEKDMIKHSENYEQYCIKCSWCKMKNTSIQKTQEEFDLLKRWIKCQKD